jgi:Protein of unknown function (DUF2933)
MEWIKKNKTTVTVVAVLAVIGALWAGVPASTLLLLGFVLACPLMMLFMHGPGGLGTHQHSSQDTNDRFLRGDHNGHGGDGQPGADTHAVHRRPSDIGRATYDRGENPQRPGHIST